MSGFCHVTPNRLASVANVDLKVSNNKTGTRKTDVNLSFTITNSQISRSRWLRQHRINYKVMRLLLFKITQKLLKWLQHTKYTYVRKT